TFGDAARMAETMNRLADTFEVKRTAGDQLPELPTVRNVRLAVNVAACDNQPLVVLLARDGQARRELESRLAPLAWGEAFLGQFVYVAAADAEELAGVEGARAGSGVLVVQPDRFGLKGKVLTQVSADAPRDELAKCLREGLALHRRGDKSFGSHVRDGQRQGVFWETVLPVTDPME